MELNRKLAKLANKNGNLNILLKFKVVTFNFLDNMTQLNTNTSSITPLDLLEFKSNHSKFYKN
jgi:cell division protein ZapA (FtsZ GTPase activity inhibitor)